MSLKQRAFRQPGMCFTCFTLTIKARKVTIKAKAKANLKVAKAKADEGADLFKCTFYKSLSKLDAAYPMD